MEIIIKKNKHLEEIENHKKKEYGCVCPNCGTVFVFKETDIIKPRMINCTKRDCVIVCPNNSSCRMTLALDSKYITEFTETFTKQDFKKKYDE